jgi:CBS domain-containing protein
MTVYEKVGALLTRKTGGNVIWSISPEATVFDAIALMAEKGIGALLVIAQDRLAGIITERDYARKVILQGKLSKETTVSEIMTTSLITVTPDTTVDECMRIMTVHRVRHLPVMEGDRTLGVLSIGDLVKAIISAQEETIEHLHTYIGVKYPA